MIKGSIKTSKSVTENNIRLSLKYSSFAMMMMCLSKLSNSISNIPISNGLDVYINSSWITELTTEIIPSIRKEIEVNPRRKATYTRNIAYGLSIIKSSFISIGFDGCNYFIVLTLNLISNVSSIWLLDKLQKHGQINGVSLCILINILLGIKGMVNSLLLHSTLNVILILCAFAILFYFNYIFLTKDNNIDVRFKNRKEKLELFDRGNFTTSVFLSYTIFKISLFIINNNIISYGLLLCSIIISGYLLFKHSNNRKDISDHIRKNNGVINNVRFDKMDKYLDKMLTKNNLINSIIGGIIFIFSCILCDITNLNMQPLFIGLIINSVIILKNNLSAIEAMDYNKYN